MKNQCAPCKLRINECALEGVIQNSYYYMILRMDFFKYMS